MELSLVHIGSLLPSEQRIIAFDALTVVLTFVIDLVVLESDGHFEHHKIVTDESVVFLENERVGNNDWGILD